MENCRSTKLVLFQQNQTLIPLERQTLSLIQSQMPLNQPVTFLEGHWTNILTWDMMIRRSTCGWVVTQIMSVKPSVKQQLTNKGTLWFLTIGFDTAQKISSLQGGSDEPDENGLACHKGGAVTDWQLPAHSLLTLAMTRVTLLCKSNRDQRERERNTFQNSFCQAWPSKHVILCQRHEDLIQSLDPWGVLLYNTALYTNGP